MNADAPILDVRDVCFSYGAQEVLHNVSFQVGARTMAAIVGPNGGGKSTLLLLLLGVLTPRHGSIRVFGDAPAVARRRVGYVPQQLQFDPKFPVNAMDVVLMGRVNRDHVGPFRRADREAALQALEQVSMADRRRRAFASLSGGERQRVLLAQALVSDPELLLLDEPTASVDALAEHALYELFHILRQRITIVFVSHNVNVVTRHVSHVLCVNRTAAMHPIAEIMSAEFREAYGGDLAVLLHDVHCHVLDASGVMRSRHAAERPGARPTEAS